MRPNVSGGLPVCKQGCLLQQALLLCQRPKGQVSVNSCSLLSIVSNKKCLLLTVVKNTHLYQAGAVQKNIDIKDGLLVFIQENIYVRKMSKSVLSFLHKKRSKLLSPVALHTMT